MTKVKPSVRQVLVRVLLPLLAGMAGAAGMLALLAWIMVKAVLPVSYAGAFATVAVCFGCFVAAWLGARLRGSGGLLCGLLSFLVCAVLLALAALLAGCRTLESEMLIRTLLLLPGGCAGGLLGMRQSGKARRHRI